jgi:hypothetical protein
MARELKPCGTPAAYARHLYHDEPPCESCRAAHSAHKTESNSERSRFRAAARQRALTRLKRKFPKTYRAFLEEELAR